MKTKIALSLIPRLSSDDQMLTIWKKTNYNIEVGQVLFTTLRVVEMSYVEKLDLMQKANFQWQLCQLIMPYIEVAYQAFQIMEKTNYEENVCRSALHFLESDNGILLVAEKTNFNIRFCADAITRLQSKKTVLLLMKKTSYHWRVCQVGIALLPTPDDVLLVMGKTNYNWQVCRAGVDFLDLKNKTEQQLLDLFIQANYHLVIFQAILPFLKLAEKNLHELLSIAEKTGYYLLLFEQIIPYLKINEQSFSDALLIVEKTGYHFKACQEAIPLLTREEDLLLILKNIKMPYDVLVDVLPLLKLAKKTQKELLAIMEMVDYRPEVCSKVIEYLIQEEDVLMTIIRANYDWRVCLGGMKLINDQSIIFDIMAKTDFVDEVCQAGFERFELLAKK